MKGCLTLILGFILGAVAMFLLFSVSIFKFGDKLETNLSPKDLVLFEQVGDCVGSGTYRIKEVLDENYAIAEEVEKFKYSDDYSIKYDTPEIVIKSDKENSFYDNQLIKLPSGKCMRQIGIYTRYLDTYPVVKILD